MMVKDGLKVQAYQTIKQMILNLELAPNERIVEQELAEKLNISRTPVREAISRLASEGFIKVVPRRGCYCVSFSMREIDDIIDVRLALETLATKACIRKGLSKEQIDSLAALTHEFEQCIANDDRTNVNRLDSEFHQQIALYSGNKLVIDYLRDIEHYMTIARNLEFINKGMSKGHLAARDHRNLLAAMIEGNAEMAVQYLEENLNNMRLNLEGRMMQ